MRRIITIAIAAGLVLAAPSVASAHNFGHQVGCGGITWSATNYQANETNTIVVTIDGGVVYSDSSFGTTDTGSRVWSQTINHSWSVVVNAPGSQFDHNVSGVQTACQSTTTTSTSTTTTTTSAPTTTTEPPTTTSSTVTTSSPSTTLPPDSTTTVEVGEPPIPSSIPTIPPNTQPTAPSASDATDPILPVTGPDGTARLLIVACALVAAGILLAHTARRP